MPAWRRHQGGCGSVQYDKRYRVYHPVLAVAVAVVVVVVVAVAVAVVVVVVVVVAVVVVVLLHIVTINSYFYIISLGFLSAFNYNLSMQYSFTA